MDKVKSEIETLLYENAEDLEIAKVLKKEIKSYFNTLEDTFVVSGGKDFLVKHTKKMDNTLKLIFKVAQRSLFGDYTPMKNSIPIALVALGSYGREQLCVHSDIDLMIVYKKIPGYNIEQMIEKILYILWDTGLKLGHRVHTVDELYESSKTDITIKTALIESRFIEGSHFIWTETQNAITQIRHDHIKEFINAKLQEKERKHKKYPLTMEPNLKEGVGGLRDANLVYWIGKILYNASDIKSIPNYIIDEKEYKEFRISLEFLFRVRSALHLASEKKEDKLRLDLIPKVSKILGYRQNKNGHMKFAKKVTSCLKVIRLYSTIWVEILTRSYQEEETKRYIIPSKKGENFHTLLTALCQYADKPFYAYPTFLKELILSSKPEHPDDALYKIISNIFYQPYSYSILTSLSHAKLLEYTFAPLKKIINLPQFDGYHQYTVDTHLMRCVYHLEHIQDNFIQSLFNKFSDDEKAMLKLVTLFHDAGKGRKKSHHLVGSALFKKFSQKMLIDKSLIKMGEILILHHTLMSNVAQREDLYNEKIILGFVSHFKNQKLLDMIYVLTYVDINGVGPNTYNSFNARLLKILYKHSLEVLEKTTMLDEAEKREKKESRLKNHTKFLSLKKSEQKMILRIPSNLFFLRYNVERILNISEKAFVTKSFEYHISNTHHLVIEIIRADTFNLNYLLSKLNHLGVVNMDICKLFNELKYFKIDFESNVNESEIPHIEQTIQNAYKTVENDIAYTPTIKKEDISIDCDYSKAYAVMRLNTRNQKGLLAFVIKIFDEIGVDVVTAKTHTLKNKVKDMFLIEKNGNFCHNVEIIIEKLTKR